MTELSVSGGLLIKGADNSKTKACIEIDGNNMCGHQGALWGMVWEAWALNTA
jgi:hypothetical protein